MAQPQRSLPDRKAKREHSVMTLAGFLQDVRSTEMLLRASSLWPCEKLLKYDYNSFLKAEAAQNKEAQRRSILYKLTAGVTERDDK